MKSSLFLEGFHEEGDTWFNPELPPMFDDDVNEFFSPSNGVHDEVQSLAATNAPLEVCSMSSHVRKGIGKRLHFSLLYCVYSRRFVSWLYEFECYIKNNHFYGERKSEFVVPCLRNNALLWFNDITPHNKNSVMSNMKSGQRWRSVMKRNFIMKPFMLDLKTKLDKVTQGSIQERLSFYSGLYSEIVSRINIEANESIGVMCFLVMYAGSLIIEAKVDIESSTKANDRHIATTYEFKGRLEVDFYGINSKSSGFGIFPCYSDAFLNAGCDGPVSAGGFEMNALCTGSQVNSTKAGIGDILYTPYYNYYDGCIKSWGAKTITFQSEAAIMNSKSEPEIITSLLRQGCVIMVLDPLCEYGMSSRRCYKGAKLTALSLKFNTEINCRLDLPFWFVDVQKNANMVGKQRTESANAFHETSPATARYFITIFDPGGIT